LQRQGSLRISHGHEDKTNGTFGSKYYSINRSDRFDTIRDGRMLDTPNKRGDSVGMGSPRSILLNYCKSSHFEEWSASSIGQIGVKGF